MFILSAFQSYLTAMKNVLLTLVTMLRSSRQCRDLIKVDLRFIG